MLKFSRIASTLLCSAACLVAGTACAGDYALKSTFKIGGEGGWDYLTYDAVGKRLFVGRGTRVQVIDPDKGTVIAEIPDTPGVHGVALAQELGKGYVSNGRDNSVSVFDLKTLKVSAKIATTGGENPDFIAYDPVSKKVFAFNGRTKNASVIDATTDKLVATIPLKGKPEAAVADGKGMMFVDIESSNELTAIDTAKNTVASTWAMTGCDEPAGLAMDTVTRRLFVGCHNKVMLVVNADGGKVIATLPVGEGVDANAFDAQSKLAFSSQGDGTLTVIKEVNSDSFRVQQTVPTQRGARTMALNPDNHDVYLVTAEFDEAPPAAGQTRPRRVMKPGSFVLLVVSEKK